MSRTHNHSTETHNETRVESIDMSWFIVKDLEAAIKFFTEVVGLKLMEKSPHFKWAELQGHNGGSFIGITEANSGCGDLPAGINSITTFTVANIERSKAAMEARGATMDGDIMEVPGHVKIQGFFDADGNRFQIVEVIAKMQNM